MAITLTRYTPADAAEWNRFVDASRNGTFLLDRNFMDYHSDRFEDWSYLVRDTKDRLIAVLPANRNGDELVSHGGLTYGGFVVGARIGTPEMLEIFQALTQRLPADGFDTLTYKTIPPIYHRAPAQEDQYALWRHGAELIRRDVLSCVDTQHRLSWQERRRRGIGKATRAGVWAGESERWAEFWDLLSARLKSRYGTQPVHSLDEIRLLQSRFPDRIRLFVATYAGRVVSGTVVFDSSPAAAHAQYIAADDTGRETHAQDLLFAQVMHAFEHCRWFDFGISNEDMGRWLNDGLVTFKEGFGARCVVHDIYMLRL